MCQERIADPNMRGDGSAEISGQQDRAQNCCLRYQIKNCANEQNKSDRQDEAFRVAKFDGSFDDGFGFYEFPYRVH